MSEPNKIDNFHDRVKRRDEAIKELTSSALRIAGQKKLDDIEMETVLDEVKFHFSGQDR